MKDFGSKRTKNTYQKKVSGKQVGKCCSMTFNDSWLHSSEITCMKIYNHYFYKL